MTLKNRLVWTDVAEIKRIVWSTVLVDMLILTHLVKIISSVWYLKTDSCVHNGHCPGTSESNLRHLFLVHQSSLFPSGFLTKFHELPILSYVFLVRPISHPP
jgi:hypothetical protein